MSRIVVVGSYNRDVSLNVARLPATGETVLARGRLQSPGGKGSNQAIQAARAGAKTAVIVALGADAAGEEAMALWAAEGIETAGVTRLADIGTGMAVILVDASGENMIVVDQGANARLVPADIDAARPMIDAAGLVLAQLETPVAATLRAFELARAAGAVTVLNAAPAPEQLPAALLAAVDVLVVNEVEARALSSQDNPAAIGEAVLGRVRRAVVLTLGARGAMLFEHGRPPHALAPPKVDVVDTTGAGDAFTGAFAARLVATGDARGALAWGIVAGALACTVRGAAGSCPAAADIEKWSRVWGAS